MTHAWFRALRQMFINSQHKSRKVSARSKRTKTGKNLAIERLGGPHASL
jgi:hypothetical protein